MLKIKLKKLKIKKTPKQKKLISPLASLFMLAPLFMLAFAAVFLTSCGKTENPSTDDDPPALHEESLTQSENPVETTETVTPITAVPAPERETASETPSETSPREEITVSPIEENEIILTAQSLLGIEFVDGGSSPSEGFDNSGLIYYVLRSNGYVNCPRGINEQASMGNKINSISELKSGDLVFFSDSGEMVQFGGIYIGDGIMISCRMPGEFVSEFDIKSDYYRNSFFTGVRVL